MQTISLNLSHRFSCSRHLWLWFRPKLKLQLKLQFKLKPKL